MKNRDYSTNYYTDPKVTHVRKIYGAQGVHKYSIMYVDTETHGYDLILTSNTWDEVLDFVKQHQPSN